MLRVNQNTNQQLPPEEQQSRAQEIMNSGSSDENIAKMKATADKNEQDAKAKQANRGQQVKAVGGVINKVGDMFKSSWVGWVIKGAGQCVSGVGTGMETEARTGDTGTAVAAGVGDAVNGIDFKPVEDAIENKVAEKEKNAQEKDKPFENAEDGDVAAAKTEADVSQSESALSTVSASEQIGSEASQETVMASATQDIAGSAMNGQDFGMGEVAMDSIPIDG